MVAPWCKPPLQYSGDFSIQHTAGHLHGTRQRLGHQGTGPHQGCNIDAAIAQIKVAPTVKDLKALQAGLAQASITGRLRHLDAAVEDNLALLSAPRLHRSP